MKTTKLIRGALFAAVLAIVALTGCEEVDTYSIKAPSDLENQIDSVAYIAIRQQEIADSIEAAEAAALEARLIDDVYQMGATDNSTGWWGGHSKYYRSENNADTIYVKFKNFTGAANVWSNWVQAITNDVPRGGDGYLEYAIWRADNYSNFAWGTENGTAWNTSNEGDTHGQQQTTNYPDMATENEDFAEYMNLMNGADCVASITRGGDSIYVDVTMTALSGKVLKKSFYIVERGIEDQPIRVFWVTDGNHIVFYKTLNPPLDEFIPDFELDPNWDSGNVEEIEEEEEEVAGSTYRADMTATITSSDNQVFTYTFFAEGLPYGGYGSFLVTDGGHMVIDPTETYYCALSDTTNSNAWYYPYSEETIVGLEDNTTPWWTAFTEYTAVIGEAYFNYKFVNHTGAAGENWNNWVLVLTNGLKRESNSYKEAFVVRADNYGWGDYYVGENLSNNFDWDNFNANMDGATVEISLKVSSESTDELKSFNTGRALQPGETLK